MIFPYVRYKIEPTLTIPSGEVHRPLIPVRFFGRKGSIQVFGLLDTGADNVFVSASVAEVLGVDVSRDAESALGAGGHEIDAWPGSVDIEVSHGDYSYRWKAEVRFLTGDEDPPIAYLGYAGFLEHFKATFDSRKLIVELIPHEQLAGKV